MICEFLQRNFTPCTYWDGRPRPIEYHNIVAKEGETITLPGPYGVEREWLVFAKDTRRALLVRAY